MKVSIIEYLTDNPEGKTSEIAGYLGLSVSRTRNYLKQLVEEGIAEIEGTSNKTRSYRLKR
ncbi:MAG: ArsR family transcriptional regulator [Clostridia bacterium]|nr:ArsR family transcriptional regulator [Clostridia bacterium]